MAEIKENEKKFRSKLNLHDISCDNLNVSELVKKLDDTFYKFKTLKDELNIPYNTSDGISDNYHLICDLLVSLGYEQYEK